MRTMVWVVVALFAGCLAETPSDATFGEPDDAPAETEPFGDASMETSPIKTRQENGQWVAEQTVTYGNGVGDASRATVRFATPAGGIDATSIRDGGYQVAVLKVARAADEQSARDALETISVSHDDGLQGDTLSLSVEASMEDLGGLPLPGLSISRSAHIQGQLPTHLAYTLATDASSGGTDVMDLAGPSWTGTVGSGGIDGLDVDFAKIDLTAGSGGVDLEGRTQRLTLDVGSGGADVECTCDHIAADVESGGLDLDATATATGTWSLAVGSGGADVDLRRADGQAYDVRAAAGSGGVEVELDDGEDVSEPTDNEQHVRSRGFSSAEIQTTIDVSAGSGGVDVIE